MKNKEIESLLNQLIIAINKSDDDKATCPDSKQRVNRVHLIEGLLYKIKHFTRLIKENSAELARIKEQLFILENDHD